jgi:cation diffusion facilitator CzcD-associated flavoprotein CzcO
MNSHNNDKNLRIAIIGAGPGGLATAEALAEHGYKNIEIFE